MTLAEVIEVRSASGGGRQKVRRLWQGLAEVGVLAGVRAALAEVGQGGLGVPPFPSALSEIGMVGATLDGVVNIGATLVGISREL